MKRYIAPFALALLLLPAGRASAQRGAEAPLDQAGSGPGSSASNLSIAIGVTAMAAGGVSRGHDPRLVLGMGVPLLALGVSDVILGLAQRSADGPGSPGFQQRLRTARVSLLVSGAGLASLGAFWSSDLSLGAGVALFSHSAFRLLMELVTPRAQPPRFEVGVSVLPSPYGRVATATFGGAL